MPRTKCPGPLRVLVAYAICTLLPDVSQAADATPRRPFTVRDSVEMWRFVEGPVFRSDGQAFAILTQRGNLQSNETEAELRIGMKSKAGWKLRVAARLSADINGGNEIDDHGRVIGRIFWSTDGRALYFLGREFGENRRLFVVRESAPIAEALTPANLDVVSCEEDAGLLLCLTGSAIERGLAYAADHPSNPDAVLGTGQALDDLLFPNSRLAQRYSPTQFDLWTLQGGEMRRVGHLLGSYYIGAMTISPDHRRAVVVAHAQKIPSEWESLPVPNNLDSTRFHADPDPAVDDGDALARARRDYARARQYWLVDLERGAAEPLIDAPVADFLRGLEGGYWMRWSPDGRRVAISSTWLPASEGAARPPCIVAVVELQGRATQCLAESDGEGVPEPEELKWAATSSQITAVWRGRATNYREREGRWEQVGAPLPSTRRHKMPAVTVRQDLDIPPVLWARDPLFDPNPQLAALALGRVTRYHWKTVDGITATGGLVTPPDYVPSRRYPLVIQTHGFDGDQFFRTGTVSETANAGRAIAARGMLVLQVQEPHSKVDGTWQELVQRGLHVYLAAVDQLAAEGRVDPSLVGVTGYSRTGIFVAKAITEAPERFAAAAVSNTAPGSLFDYYQFVDGRSSEDVRRLAELWAGEKPYGEGLKRWIERAAGFRTDRIRSPLLITAGDPPELLALWSLYAPLRDQGKPVELQYFRRGQHNLTRPLEVLAHQEMLVDWFDFWLKGHQDATPAKRGQYERWRAMRETASRGIAP